MPPTSNLIASSKEHFLAALNSIDGNPRLRIQRESQEYDLIYENKRYPPILVLSEANRLLGGSQLLLSDFGNSTKKAFKPLLKAGFSIEKKAFFISKDAVLSIINLCDTIAKGREEKTIDLGTYTEKFTPYVDSFKQSFGSSPNLYLQKQLKNFNELLLKEIKQNTEIKSFPFWG